MASDKYLGIVANKYIYINKTYKESACSNGNLIHQMIFSDTKRDQNGNWITLGTYSLIWFDTVRYSQNEKCKITNIKGCVFKNYINKNNQPTSMLECTIELISETNPPVQQPQEAYYQGNASYYDENDY